MEELILIQLAGLTTRASASNAWQALSGALLAGTLAPTEVVILVVHDYLTLKSRTGDAADSAYNALKEPPLLYTGLKGKELKAHVIRVKPPVVRRRGVAFSPYHQAIAAAFTEVEITHKHKTKGKPSATTFFVECADGGKDDFVRMAAVLWTDSGSEVDIVDCEAGLGALATLAGALRKLAS